MRGFLPFTQWYYPKVSLPLTWSWTYPWEVSFATYDLILKSPYYSHDLELINEFIFLSRNDLILKSLYYSHDLELIHEGRFVLHTMGCGNDPERTHDRPPAMRVIQETDQYLPGPCSLLCVDSVDYPTAWYFWLSTLTWNRLSMNYLTEMLPMRPKSKSKITFFKNLIMYCGLVQIMD